MVTDKAVPGAAVPRVQVLSWGRQIGGMLFGEGNRMMMMI